MVLKKPSGKMYMSKQTRTEIPTDLTEKIGRMIMTGFRGLSLSDTDPICEDLRLGRIGGVVLFDTDAELGSPLRNVESGPQLSALIADIKRRSLHPPLIGTDQEGGRVARLKARHGFPAMLSQRELGQEDDPDLTRRNAEVMADLLSELGFNLNFAPVVDLDINPDSPAIGFHGRSLAADAQTVIRHSRIIVKTLLERGILPVLKHFPGHGSAQNDTHLGLTDVTDTWNREELLPYETLIREGQIPMVMTAHLFNRHLDPDYPATLSQRIVTRLLRQELGFEGVIISDDLNMRAIRDHYGLETAVERAVLAGVDILLFGNNLYYDAHIAEKVQGIIIDAVQSGRISHSRIDDSYRRIERLHAFLSPENQTGLT
jgi:beta-N-acetylhexosaminidase